MAGWFLVVDDPADLETAATRARAAGRDVHAAEVRDSAAAQQAVLAALAGKDLVLACPADDEVADALLDDLRRLGTVRHQTVSLGDDQVALLQRLQAGQSLGAAAAAEHLSRRTADRRLAQARAALGVRSTPEALVAAVRLGLLPAHEGH